MYCPDLLNTLIKELQACMSVTDEGALLYELREHLSPRELGVKFLLRPIS